MGDPTTGGMADALAGLTPEQQQAWTSQFGALPQTNQPPTQLEQPPPPVQTPPGVGDLQQYANQMTALGNSPPTQLQQPLAQPPPQQPPANPLANLTPQQQQAWMQQFGNPNALAQTPVTPAIQSAQRRPDIDLGGPPERQLDKLDQQDQQEPTSQVQTAAPANQLGAGMGDVENDQEQLTHHAQGVEQAPPKSTEADVKKAADEAQRIREIHERMAKMQAEHDAAMKREGDEAAKREAARRAKLTPTQRAEEDKARSYRQQHAENLRQQLPELGSDLRDIQQPNQRSAQGNQFGQTIEGLPQGWSMPQQQQQVAPPTVEGAGTRQGLINSLQNPVQQGAPSKPLSLPTQEIAGPHQITPVAPMGRSQGPDTNVDLSGMRPDVTIQQPGRGFDRGDTNVDTSGMRAPGAQPAGVSEGVERMTAEDYPPARYVPGSRQAAAWTVREGQPVSPEDQERMFAAQGQQQGAINHGARSGQQNAADLENDAIIRQHALESIDAANRQSQLDRQRQTQAQVDKLADITKQIQSRKLDDHQLFLLPGAAGSFFSAIGQALGAGAAARLGGANHAADYVKNRAAQLVNDQKLQLEQDRGKLDTQNNLVAQMRKQFGDDELGDQAAKIALLERGKVHTDEIAYANKGREVGANAAAMSADLNKQIASDHIAFNRMAQDSTVRKDLMTKGQMVGGPPANAGEGADAGDETVVTLPHEAGGYAPGTRLRFSTKDQAIEARDRLTAYGIAQRVRNHIAQLEQDNPNNLYNPISKAHNALEWEISQAAGQIGHLQGVKKLPIFDAENVQRNLTPSWTNRFFGASATDRADNFLKMAKDPVEESLLVGSPELARRHLSVDQHGQVTPGNHYTGANIQPRNLPKGFAPVGKTSPGVGTKEMPALNYKPEVRHVVTTPGKGKKKATTTETSVEPEEDDE